MKVFQYIWFLSFLFVLLISCKTGTTKDQSSAVNYHGRIDAAMSGDLTTKYELDSLRNVVNIYALGAMEELSGEIQIFNGQDYSSTVVDDSVLVGGSENQNAAFIVYSQVKNWKDLPIPLSVTNMEALIGFFEYNEESELNTDKPFMFLIEGRVEQLDWHVLMPSTKDSPDVAEHNKHLVKSGSIIDEDVEILGVYSRDHEGVFTHHGMPVHMHFRTMDGMLAGHVDALELGPEMNLKIPPTK